jgi:protein SCO1
VKILLSFIFLASVSTAQAGHTAPGKLSTEVPEPLKGIGITEHLGEKVDLSMKFTDESGKEVILGKFFTDHKPVLLSLVYYGCPNLCSFYLNGVMDVMKQVTWKAGDEFKMVVVSIDPSETPELAKTKKANYIKEYGQLGEWHFLVGTEANVKALAKQVGFGYRWDNESKQWAHSAAAMVLTPGGEISRYLYGIMFDPQTLRLSLVEASKNKIGSLMDKVLLFCFRFDPHAKKYSFYAYNLMRASAGMTVLLLALFMVPYWRRQKALGEPPQQGDVG